MRRLSARRVLFFDADADGALSQKREYVFTEWDPTAATDMEALRSYFDTNGDGKLTSADTAFAQFKVLVTNADGSTTVKTLAQLGITEINLTEDSTRIELADGSVIVGQTAFRKSDGSTGTNAVHILAPVKLCASAAAFRIPTHKSGPFMSSVGQAERYRRLKYPASTMGIAQ